MRARARLRNEERKMRTRAERGRKARKEKSRVKRRRSTRREGRAVWIRSVRVSVVVSGKMMLERRTGEVEVHQRLWMASDKINISRGGS
jgi:hypothetical protein